jgi:hypothetical protein
LEEGKARAHAGEAALQEALPLACGEAVPVAFLLEA